MSRLLEITEELRDLHGELSRVERVVAENPGLDSLSIDYLSLSKRQRRLEAEFDKLAQKSGLDVVKYRLVPNIEESVPLRAMTRTLDRFQAAITTIYASIKLGSGKRPKLTRELQAASGFDFGYSYSGSLGIALTLPKENVLFGISELESAVSDFFKAAASTTRDEVIEFAHQRGISSVRRLYEWSAAHADFDMAADINWIQGNETHERLQVAPRSLRKLKEIIEETSETTDEPVSIFARLPGLDTENRTFHLVGSDNASIEGRWSDSFAYDATYVLDMDYEADLVKRTKVHFAFEKEEAEWLLVELRRIQTDQ